MGGSGLAGSAFAFFAGAFFLASCFTSFFGVLVFLTTLGGFL